LPWLKGKELARLERMVEYFLLNSQFCRQTAIFQGYGEQFNSSFNRRSVGVCVPANAFSPGNFGSHASLSGWPCAVRW
jgi:hypothetical protein